MIRFKKSKKILAAILTAGMLLAGNGVPICAAEPVSVAQTEEQLNYLVVGSPVVCTPGSQFVLADVGDGTEKLSDAVLTYVNVETGTSYEVTADTVDEGSLLFNMEFDDTQPSGEYEVTTIEVVADGEKRIVRMVELKPNLVSIRMLILRRMPMSWMNRQSRMQRKPAAKTELPCWMPKDRR